MSSQQRRPVFGALVFYLVVPGVVTVLIPFWIAVQTLDEGQTAGWGIVGLPLIAGGLTLLVGGFGQFLGQRDRATPLAWNRELVIGGLHRFVRNPMYLAGGAVIVGQAAVFRSWGVMLYAMALGVAVYGFVTWYEQPTMARRYGRRYAEYVSAVPGWWPRSTPWTPTDRVGGF